MPRPPTAVVLALLALGAAGCGDRAAAGAPPPAVPSGALRYAVLGDSYSNGQSAGPGAAWPDQLARRLTGDGLPVRVVANPSVTGATTAQMLATGLPVIRAARPDVITVLLGVNDQVQGHSLAQFAQDDDRALRAAIAVVGSADRVLAVDIPDYSVSPAGGQFGDPAAIAAAIDAFNGVVRRVAARHGVRVVSVVDISRAQGAAGIGPDGLHPSRAQLSAWASRIAAVARRRWAAAARDPGAPAS